MTTADLFLKAVIVGPEVQIRTREGEVIMRCYEITEQKTFASPKRAIKKLLACIDANIAEREEMARG